MRKEKRRWRWLVPLGALLVLFAFHPVWLAALGRYLVSASAPAQADIVVVLAGDFEGNRVLKACDLIRQGYAPLALVSGPSGAYGAHESDLAIAFAAERGCPREWFVGLPSDVRSTREEAALITGELRRRGIKRYLLVTSDYHTRRSGALFRSFAPDLEAIVVAAPDRDFTADGWWQTRQGRKVWLVEWMKTVAEWFGI